jgi:hypothetical protein
LFDSINPDRLGEAFDILNRLNPRNVNSISQAVERLSAILTDADKLPQRSATAYWIDNTGRSGNQGVSQDCRIAQQVKGAWRMC